MEKETLTFEEAIKALDALIVLSKLDLDLTSNTLLDKLSISINKLIEKN